MILSDIIANERICSMVMSLSLYFSFLSQLESELSTYSQNSITFQHKAVTVIQSLSLNVTDTNFPSRIIVGFCECAFASAVRSLAC